MNKNLSNHKKKRRLSASGKPKKAKRSKELSKSTVVSIEDADSQDKTSEASLIDEDEFEKYLKELGVESFGIQHADKQYICDAFKFQRIVSSYRPGGSRYRRPYGRGRSVNDGW